MPRPLERLQFNLNKNVGSHKCLYCKKIKGQGFDFSRNIFLFSSHISNLTSSKTIILMAVQIFNHSLAFCNIAFSMRDFLNNERLTLAKTQVQGYLNVHIQKFG